MAVTVSYTLNFVKNLDLAQGPATSNPDATSLANGGFAVAGKFISSAALEIFSETASSLGGATFFPGTFPDIDQLSNGNIVVDTNGDVGGNIGTSFVLTTEAGNFIKSSPFSLGFSLDKVSALTGGGFWSVRLILTSPTRSDVNARVVNDDVVTVGDLNLTTSVTGSFRDPNAVGLANGNVAVTWKDTLNKIYYGIYSPLGSVVKVPSPVGTTDAASHVALMATAKGFALAYADTSWATGGSDITLKQFGFDGALLRTSNVSNPSLSSSIAKEAQPALTQLSNDSIGVAYQLTIPPVIRGDPTVIDTVAIIVDPATGARLAAKSVVAGEASTDQVETPTIAGFASGGVAVFHHNVTDNDIDGEHLQAVRTSSGDAAKNNLIGDSLIDVMRGNGGNDLLRGLGGNDRLGAGKGNDIVEGGRGCDLMAGGDGSDVFRYLSTDDSPSSGLTCDRITDFRHQTDKINFTAIDAKANTLGNNTFIFRGTLGFTSEGQVRVIQKGQNTLVELNTTGGTGAEMTIQLDKVNASSLSLIDFLF